MATTSQWYHQISSELAKRDGLEKDTFQHVIQRHTELAEKNALFAERIAELENGFSNLQLQHQHAVRDLELARQVGSPENVKKLQDLESQVQSLKDERIELYKSQGTNAQRVLELTDKTRTQEQELLQKSESIAALEGTIAGLHVKLQDKDHLITEKDRVIQILRDEHAALSLELTKKDERLTQLEKENADVLERYLQLKNELANRMNEANEYVEDALKLKVTSPNIRRASSGSTSSKSPAEPSLPLKDYVALPTAVVRKMTGHSATINCIDASPDGTLFGTGSDDKTILLWDARTGALKATLQGANAGIMCIDFGYGSDMVLAGSNDNAARIWSLSTGRLRHSLTGHLGKVFAARFTLNSRAVTGSHDRTLKVWDINRGYCIKNVFTLSSCNDLAMLDEGGSSCVSGHLDNNLRVWDLNTGKAIREVTGIHSGQITGVTISHDRNQVLTTSRDNTLKLLDARMWEVLKTFTAEHFRVGMNHAKSTLSPDGHYVLSGSINGDIYGWNANTGQVESILKVHNHAVCGVVWSAIGGSKVYSADVGKGITIWGSPKDQLLHV